MYPPSPPISGGSFLDTRASNLNATPPPPVSSPFSWNKLLNRRKSSAAPISYRTTELAAPFPSNSRRLTLPSITPFITPSAFPVLSSVGEISSSSTVSSFSSNLSDYAIGNIIGIGASALVFSAKYVPLDCHVAMKRIDLDCFHQLQIEELRKEVQTMALCRHPYLLPVFQSFSAANHLFIITPLLTAGSLNHILKSLFPKGLPESAIATILTQVLLGVSYLHKHGIFHRDIKCGNILIDRVTGLVQLGDFGVSSSLCEGMHRISRRSFVGTVLWMAPEIMEQSSYNSKADIWSLGITCLEMAEGHAPKSQYPPLKAVMLILSNPPPTLNRQNTHFKYSRTLKDFIDSCLFRNPTLRSSADKLLSTPFIKKAKKPMSLVKTLNLASLPSIYAGCSSHTENTRSTSMSCWDFDCSSEIGLSITDSSLLQPDVNVLCPGPTRNRANSAMDIFQIN